MAATHTESRKGPKFLELKILIAVLSIAVTFGLWGLLSFKALQDEKNAPTAVLGLAPQIPAAAGLGLPPLPTLVPLVDVSASTVGSPATSNAGESLPLRSVSAPAPAIVQRSMPVFNQGFLGSGSFGSTRSSR